MSSQVFWFAARASGIVAWALAAASVLWGLALSTRVLGRRPRPAWLFDLHRFLGGLALLFVGVHVLAVLADSYVHFSLLNLLVPLTGDWHPLAVAWGILGLYLLLAVELTSLARTRLPRALWRRVHYASFVVFAATTLHGLTAGTDARSPALLLAYLTVSALVAGLTASRVLASTRRSADTATPGRLHHTRSAVQAEQSSQLRIRNDAEGSPRSNVSFPARSARCDGAVTRVAVRCLAMPCLYHVGRNLPPTAHS